MSCWDALLGHEGVVEVFRRAVRSGRLGSTFLFVGPAGIGKRTFARRLAQALLCERHQESELEACGACSACHQVAADSHPDLLTIAKPEEKSFIPLELLIGDDEHRMREGLLHQISLKPYAGGRKIAILDDCDYLNQEGANCLLKTLEEPPPRAVMILIGTSVQRQLPTIRSRSQIIRFSPLSEAQVTRLLWERKLVESEDEAAELARHGAGSIQQALEFADPEVREFRKRWFDFLATPSSNPFGFTKELSAFIDAAGKEAPPRRARFKQVARWGTEFFRHVLLDMVAEAEPTEPRLVPAVEAARRWIRHPDLALASMDRCLEIQLQVDANANQATLVECWLDDLASMNARPRVR